MALYDIQFEHPFCSVCKQDSFISVQKRTHLGIIYIVNRLHTGSRKVLLPFLHRKNSGFYQNQFLVAKKLQQKETPRAE